MSSSFGLWLVVILALLTGLVVWRILTGQRTDARPATPIVEGDPATAGDQEQPAAVVDEVPAPVAVTEEPARAEDEPAMQPVGAETAVEDEPAAAAEPVSAEAAPVATEVEPSTPATEVEPDPTPVAIPAPRVSVENAARTEVDTAEAPVAASADDVADDFRQIQGIGPKMATALQAAGIRTYQQLAELDEPALRETIKAAGLRATPSLATWPQQAKLLAGANAEADAVLPVGAGGNA